MAHVALETESTLTDRFQTTVPSSVRQALRLGKKDKIKYAIQSDGSVVISRVASQESDPVIGESLSASMRESVNTLVHGVEIDLDAPLLDEDE